MSNRVQDFGMDVAISRKLNSKYDPQTEREVTEWIRNITGENVPLGRDNVHSALKNGLILIKLINAVYDKTPNLPPRAQHVRRPIKANTMNAPFKQMENIQVFLNTAEAYGVPAESLFQTVDLFECRNMAQVLNTVAQLGTECQRNSFQGPVCGPRPTFENRRQFSESTIRSGQGIIGLQAGTNKLASQKGMAMGGQRHISDIKVEDMCQSGSAVIGLQMGTNQCASQKGMSMGTARHISDIKCEEMTREGQAVIGLQMGTNQCASQKGMHMGASRHINDLHLEAGSREGQSIINLQYGTNKLASQAGMRMGGQRHIADIKTEDMSREGSSTISLQMGPTQSQVASQSGMSFGAQRHILDSH